MFQLPITINADGKRSERDTELVQTKGLLIETKDCVKIMFDKQEYETGNQWN